MCKWRGIWEDQSVHIWTNLDSILKSRDITLPAKVRLVKAMVFPAVMYGCESWTVKKAERQRIDAFELWCWRRLLRVPWIARRSNQSILKEISSGYSLEGATPILWPPHAKSWLIGKDSDAGRDWGQEEKGMTEDEMPGWHHQLDGRVFEWTLGVGDGQGGLACCNSWGHRVGHDWATELNWTESIYEHLSTFVWRSQCVRVQLSVSVLELTERMRPLVDRWAGLRQSEAPRYLPCPWNVDVAHSSHTRSHVKNAALRV